MSGLASRRGWPVTAKKPVRDHLGVGRGGRVALTVDAASRVVPSKARVGFRALTCDAGWHRIHAALIAPPEPLPPGIPAG